MNQISHSFDGHTFDSSLDGERLSSLLKRVETLMSDGQWRFLEEIAKQTGGTESSVSARLRDLRKPKFGGYRVERRRFGIPESGLFEYRVLPPFKFENNQGEFL